MLKKCDKNKYILFTGGVPKEQVSWLYDKIEQKTGWSRMTIKRKKGRN